MSGAVRRLAMSTGPLKPAGQKQVEQLSQWVPSLVTFGATAGAGLLYFTDWRLICDFIPFYNTKYVKETES